MLVVVVLLGAEGGSGGVGEDPLLGLMHVCTGCACRF